MCQGPPHTPHTLPCPPGPLNRQEPCSSFPFLPPQVGARLNAVEQQIWESRTSLEKDVKVLSELLARLGKETLGSLEHLQDFWEAEP